MPMKEPMYQIHWKISEKCGKGNPLPLEAARELKDKMNAEYGPGTHWIVSADIVDGDVSMKWS